MDYLQRMNRALDYIEGHLADELDYREAAKQACCSSFYFQRMFSFIADIPLSEYIRRRRLTLAAFELQHSKIKVIDLALKYRYESPNSFARAFQNLHGITPSSAREMGAQLKAYPRITFHISIKGDVEMNYRIEEKEGFSIVGVKKNFISSDEGTATIPAFWSEMQGTDMIARIAALSNGKPYGVHGFCVPVQGDKYDYFIACMSDGEPPEGMYKVKVPKSTWAIFDVVGPMPGAMQECWKRIFTEWMPASGYEHAGTTDVEWYTSGDNASENYRSEIWIPVVKSSKD